LPLAPQVPLLEHWRLSFILSIFAICSEGINTVNPVFYVWTSRKDIKDPERGKIAPAAKIDAPIGSRKGVG
jgi:hypothetical protein